MRWLRAFPESMGCMPRSCPCSRTRSLVPAAFWCWGRIRLSPCDSRGRVTSLGRRSHACGRPREHDGGGVGSGVHPDRYVAPGFRYRTPLQADPLRLHERHRTHSADQPAAEALRLLSRCRRSIARPRAHWGRHSRRTGELDLIHSRRQHTRRDPFAQALQAHPWPSARRRRSDYRGRYTEPRHYRRGEGSRSAAARTAIVCGADNQFCSPRRHHYRWLCCRHGGVRGHQRLVADIRRQDPHAGRSESGNDRPWALPISPPAFFKDFRSAAAHHAHRSPKRPARRRSSPESWAPSRSRCFWYSHPTC